MLKWLRRGKGRSPFDVRLLTPRIKSVKFLEAVRPHLEEASGDPQSQEPVANGLAGDLLVAYALDLGDTFTFVSYETMELMGLDPLRLHERAVKNLSDKLINGVGVQDLTLYRAVVTGEHLEATSLLLPWLWEQVAATVEGEILLTVPSRDAVYFTGSGQRFEAGGREVGSDQALRVMCGAALDEKQAKGVHGLSELLFKWDGGGWEVVNPIEFYL